MPSSVSRVMDDVAVASTTNKFLLSKGRRVKLHNSFAQKHLDRTGTIVGHSIAFGGQPVYLVGLDVGFYSPEQDMYVSIIVCALDCVVECPDD